LRTYRYTLKANDISYLTVKLEMTQEKMEKETVESVPRCASGGTSNSSSGTCTSEQEFIQQVVQLNNDKYSGVPSIIYFHSTATKNDVRI
jgi:hypothetical protein